MKAATALGTLIALAVSATSAQAVPITPGDAFLVGTELRLDFLEGIVIAGTKTAFSGDGHFAGELVSMVLRDVPSNPLGGLTFRYEITNDVGNPNSIGRASFAGFDLLETDVQYSTTGRGGPIAPAYISRDLSGNVIGFNFFRQPAPASEIAADFLLPGRRAIVYIHTAADAYATTGTASFIDGGAASVPTFAPIPEPSSLALLSLAACVFGLRSAGIPRWQRFNGPAEGNKRPTKRKRP